MLNAMSDEKRDKAQNIQINGTQVASGEYALVKLNIGRLPTGTLIDIPIHVFNGKKKGPVVLIQAGLHGDEINGVETLRRMLDENLFQIKRGAVIVVPVLNIFGFIHFSRDVPDGKDVNRSFPGSKTGSLASRIAYHYTQEILPHVDFALDLHTGGAQRHNYPQARYTLNDTESKTLAEAFGAPFCLPSKLINGSFRKATFKLGVPTVVYEAGESMRFDEMAITLAVKGILNVLRSQKMLIGQKKIKKGASVNLSSSRWIRASRAGMFIPLIRNGQYVNKGEELGYVSDAYAKRTKFVRAPFEGHVFCINHQAVVNQGDALFHLGKEG
ncbi:MAG: succinylglutamate desuccinylase/aspartoacylase family protein [Bacteroidota bacterium]